MVVVLNFVKEGKVDVIILVGNIGVLFVGGLFVVGRIKGIDRFCLCLVILNVK